MPVTYNLIASNTLSSSAASVTFSAIPNTFTDLVVKASIRINSGSSTMNLRVRFNNDTSSNYSNTILRSSGSGASSVRNSNNIYIDNIQANGNTATANTFSLAEIYIPSYTASINKPISIDNASEDNNIIAYREALAGLYRSTAEISSITLLNASSFLFLPNSSFFLYGIKNS